MISLITKANNGCIVSQKKLGTIFYNCNNYEQSFEYYKMAADNGDLFSQYCIGYMYEEGEGTLREKNEAIKYYKKSLSIPNASINRGNPTDLYFECELFIYFVDLFFNGYDAFGTIKICIGKCYFYGKGVQKNNKKAKLWLNSAKRNGSLVADYWIKQYHL